MFFSPDFFWEFILHKDSSDFVLGTWLSQDFQGQEHLILHLSRKLFLREKAYFIIEKEVLVVR